MAKHIEKLKWANRFRAIKEEEAAHAALFTNYPTATISRAERMGFTVVITQLDKSYAPFRYLLSTLP